MSQISIIVPVYKVEPYLARCVDSILSQTHTDFELILVDDGSPDRCGAICDGYAAKDSRVVVIHQQNGGLSAARNAGLDWMFANSDSRWLTFIDSDDWVHPQYLEILLRAAEEHGVDVSMGLLLQTEEECVDFQELRGESRLCDPETMYTKHYGSSIVSCGKLMRKKLFRSIRFPVGKLFEDLHTTYQYFFTGSAIAVVDEYLYYYYQRHGSIIHSEWSVRRLDVIEGHQNAICFFRKHSYRSAELCQTEIYFRDLLAQCWAIQALPDARSYRHILKKLRCDLRKAVLRYRRFKKLPLSTNAGLYNEAFPGTMHVCWTAYGVMRKLRIEGTEVVLRKIWNRLTGR